MQKTENLVARLHKKLGESELFSFWKWGKLRWEFLKFLKCEENLMKSFKIFALCTCMDLCIPYTSWSVYIQSRRD